jgi:hypothetical protein
LGDVDLLAEVAGSGTYEKVLPDAITTTFEGLEVKCVSLRRLISLKRADRTGLEGYFQIIGPSPMAALPMKIKGGSGGPLRAIAVLRNDR